MADGFTALWVCFRARASIRYGLHMDAHNAAYRAGMGCNGYVYFIYETCHVERCDGLANASEFSPQ